MQKLKLSELQRLSPEAYQDAEKFPIVLVVDNVRSAHNVGAFFRTADAFRIKEIYLCGYTARPPHVEIYKTALGAEDTVNWKYSAQVSDTLTELKSEGYFIISLEQTDHRTLLQDLETNPEQKYALVVGNEVEGVSMEAIALSDMVVEIPQFGTKHSLNVAVATGIMLWELVKKQA